MAEDFLSIVGHLAERRHPEDQLTNCFSACFEHSPVFQMAVMDLLRSTCHRTWPRSKSLSWECRTQQPERHKNRSGRFDIVLMPTRKGGGKFPGPPMFVLESKLGAPLTRDQLGRYMMKPRARQLVAVTRHFPEVPRRWLRERNVQAIRWQDMYRQLAGSPMRGAKDRFIIESFLSYLEGHDMAYGEIFERDFQAARNVFQKISGKSSSWWGGNLDFHAVGRLMDFLGELQKEILEKIGTRRGLSRHGPYYWREEEESRQWHGIGVEVCRGSMRRYLYCAFYFSEEGRSYAYFEVHLGKLATGGSWEPIRKPFSRPVSTFLDRRRRLDEQKLLGALRNWVGRNGAAL